MASEPTEKTFPTVEEKKKRKDVPSCITAEGKRKEKVSTSRAKGRIERKFLTLSRGTGRGGSISLPPPQRTIISSQQKEGRGEKIYPIHSSSAFEIEVFTENHRKNTPYLLLDVASGRGGKRKKKEGEGGGNHDLSAQPRWREREKGGTKKTCLHPK